MSLGKLNVVGVEGKDMPRGRKRLVVKPTPKQIVEARRRLKILREYELALAESNLKAGIDMVKSFKRKAKQIEAWLIEDRAKIKKFNALLRRDA